LPALLEALEHLLAEGIAFGLGKLAATVGILPVEALKLGRAPFGFALRALRAQSARATCPAAAPSACVSASALVTVASP